MFKLNYPDFWLRRGIVSTLLVPISYIYMALGYLRKCCTKEISLHAKVICVGNITVGGSGKTRVVAWLAKLLEEQHVSCVIVTKGYNSGLKGAVIVTDSHDALAVGDESVMLKNACTTVIATKNIRDAVPLIEQINPEVVILDDGMQNPYLYKDLIILTFDSVIGAGNNRIFPAGPLRETLFSAITRGGERICVFQMNAEDQKADDFGKTPYFTVRTRLLEHPEANQKYIAFAGIGNPEKFFQILQRSGFNLQKKLAFPDHHNYSEQEQAELLQIAESENCKLITTEKDYVKFGDQDRNTGLIICARAVLELDNQQEFMDLLNEKLFKKDQA